MSNATIAIELAGDILQQCNLRLVEADDRLGTLVATLVIVINKVGDEICPDVPNAIARALQR